MRSSWIKRVVVALGLLALPLAAWAGTAAKAGCPFGCC
jgi:hypothetical protein